MATSSCRSIGGSRRRRSSTRTSRISCPMARTPRTSTARNCKLALPGRRFGRLPARRRAVTRPTSGAGRSARARLYSVRMDPKTSPELRAAATPSTQADKPVGEWNHFEITVRGKTVKVALNGKTVIAGATIPDLPDRGRLALQHHGGKNKEGDWTGPPAWFSSRIFISKSLTRGMPRSAVRPMPGAVKGLLDHRRARPRGVVLLALRRLSRTWPAAGGHQRRRLSRTTCAASTTS